MKNLPPESAYQTAFREFIKEEGIELPESDKHGAWSQSDYLLAAIVDGINTLTWQNANQGAKPGQQSEKPKPIPRPGVDGKKSKLDMEVMQDMQARREERERIVAEERARMTESTSDDTE